MHHYKSVLELNVARHFGTCHLVLRMMVLFLDDRQAFGMSSVQLPDCKVEAYPTAAADSFGILRWRRM